MVTTGTTGTPNSTSTLTHSTSTAYFVQYVSKAAWCNMVKFLPHNPISIKIDSDQSRKVDYGGRFKAHPLDSIPFALKFKHDKSPFQHQWTHLSWHVEATGTVSCRRCAYSDIQQLCIPSLGLALKGKPDWKLQEADTGLVGGHEKQELREKRDKNMEFMASIKRKKAQKSGLLVTNKLFTYSAWQNLESMHLLLLKYRYLWYRTCLFWDCFHIKRLIFTSFHTNLGQMCIFFFPSQSNVNTLFMEPFLHWLAASTSANDPNYSCINASECTTTARVDGSAQVMDDDNSWAWAKEGVDLWENCNDTVVPI